MTDRDEAAPRLEIAQPGWGAQGKEPDEPEGGVVAQADDRPLEARFKLEVMYDGKFSVHHPNMGVVCLWGTAGDHMPNADWKIYFCPREGCAGLITPNSHGDIITVCPLCKTAWKPKQLHGEYLFIMTVDKWAHRLTEFVHLLGGDSDLYLKRLKTLKSLIEAEMTERERDLGGELLNAARHMEAAVYTRDRLVKDTMAGASMEAAIRAFLLA